MTGATERAGSVASVPAATATVVLDVETRLQQNYRTVSAVNAGGTVEAVRNGSGGVELFTLGTDGTIWNFFPSPSSQSGYVGVSTGIRASTFAVVRGPDGRILLFFAPSDTEVCYVIETPDPSPGASRWSAPVLLTVEIAPRAFAKILAANLGGQLYVGVLFGSGYASETFKGLWYSAWNPDNPQFQSARGAFRSLQCVWVGSDPSTAAFACLDKGFFMVSAATNKTYNYSTPLASFSALSIDASNDGAGKTHIVAVGTDDGNAYQLLRGTSGELFGWTQLSAGLGLRQIATDVDAAGCVHIFGVSDTNRLYHWEPNPSEPSGYYPPAVIATSVASVAVAVDDEGAIDIFTVGTAHSSLTHLYLKKESHNWGADAIEVPRTGHVEQYAGYTSDVILYGADGAVLTNEPVILSVSEQTEISVNAHVYFADRDRPVRISTNGAGMLSIVQEASSLAIPALGIRVPRLMAADDLVAIQQSGVTQRKLASITGQALREARKASGGYLLQEKYRGDQKAADHVACYIRSCMDLAVPDAGAVRPVAGHHRANVGVGAPQYGGLDTLRNIPSTAEKHWRLSFADGLPEFEELTADQASALILGHRASLLAAEGFFDWLGDIGDFVAGVGSGVITVVESVVSQTLDGVSASIKCLIDDIAYFFSPVIKFIGDMYDLAQVVFAGVQVGFADLFEWLGFVFDWSDMLRTKEALAYTLGVFLDFLPGAAAGIQQIIDSRIAGLQAQIKALFDQAVRDLGAETTAGGYEKAKRQSNPALAAATANNPFYSGLLDNAGSAVLASAGQGLREALQDDPVMSKLTEYVDATTSSQAFAQAVEDIGRLGSGDEDIFSLLLSALLRLAQGVIEAALSGVQVVADAFLEAARRIVDSIRRCITESWNIPLVSDLYQWVTDGEELNALGLGALMVAVPLTIFYKATNGAAPFPDEAAVAAFKQSFNAQSMLRAAGFMTPEALTSGAEIQSGIVLPQNMQTLLRVGAGVSIMAYGGCTAVANLQPLDKSLDFKALSWVNLVLELATFGGSFPWFFSTAPPDCDENDGKLAVLWLVETVGVLLDGCFVATEDLMPENHGTTGVVAAFIWAVVHTVTVIITNQGQSDTTVAANVLPLVPELCVLLRLKPIVDLSENRSLAALAAIDFLFYLAVGPLSAISP